MDIKEIQNLIRFVSKAGVSEVKYKTKEFEISIRTTSDIIQTSASSQPAQIITTPAIAQPTTAHVNNTPSEKTEEDTSKYITIKSPMIGTFYRRASPEKDFFVNVGDTVSQGRVVCVIEAMKLFNEIESDVSGKIVKILVEDSSPVDFDQPLFLVDPS